MGTFVLMRRQRAMYTEKLHTRQSHRVERRRQRVDTSVGEERAEGQEHGDDADGETCKERW